jgi:hypothetical protein
MKTCIHLECEMFQTTVVEKNKNTHFVFNNFFPEIRVVYYIMRKNAVDSGRSQMQAWRMRYACSVTNA